MKIKVWSFEILCHSGYVSISINHVIISNDYDLLSDSLSLSLSSVVIREHYRHISVNFHAKKEKVF